jgi:phenylpyruvate tautomerase PptA (4-oxalocrotonate tautomerase family)
VPVIEIQVVGPDDGLPAGMATLLADAVGAVLGAPPGTVWVRLSVLPSTSYAENGVSPSQLPNPVFVRITRADDLPVDALRTQAKELARAIGRCVMRPTELVHIEFAPSGRGRMAFGGELLLQPGQEG